MLKSFVLNTNKEIMVLNWIKNFQWDNKAISISLNDNIEHLASLTGLENDINRNDIRAFLINYINSFESENVFNNWLTRIYNTYPYKISFKKFLEDNEIEFNNKISLQNFIINMKYSI